MNIIPKVYEINYFHPDFNLKTNTAGGLGGKVVARNLDNAMRFFEIMHRKARRPGIDFEEIDQYHIHVMVKSWWKSVLLLILPHVIYKGCLEAGWARKGLLDGKWTILHES